MDRDTLRGSPELFTALPRGTHKLAREVVVASQRGRMLDAVASCVAENGFAATTVADVVARARVSRKAFYEHFADKEGAFLAAYQLSCRVMIAEILDAAAEGGCWVERVTLGLRTYLAVLSGEPIFARAFLIEVTAAGPQARRARLELFDRFAGLFRDPEEAHDPELDTRRALVAGINELVAWKVLDGHADQLPALETTVVGLAVSVVRASAAAPR